MREEVKYAKKFSARVGIIIDQKNYWISARTSIAKIAKKGNAQ